MCAVINVRVCVVFRVLLEHVGEVGEVGEPTWGCGYLRQICSVLVRVKRRVLPGMSTFRISNMKNDRSTPLRNYYTRSGE